MSWAVLVILFFGFSYLIFNSANRIGLSPKTLLIGWFLKLFYATIFLLIFTYYYSSGSLYGDVANFMNDSKILAGYGRSDFGGYLKLLLGFNSNDLTLLQNELADTRIWSYGDNGDFINDNRLIIRINSVIHFFSFGNVWVHLLVFAFISYAGIILLFQTFKKFVHNPQVLFFGLIIFPTIGFWGSGITKECIMIFAFGLFCWGISKLLQKVNNKWTRLAAIVGMATLLFNKPHLGICVLVFLPFLIWFIRAGFSRQKLILTLIIVLGLGFSLTLAPDKVNPVNKISNKLQDFKNVGTGGVFFITDSSFCAFDYQDLNKFNYNSNTKEIQVIKSAKGEYKLFGKKEFYPFTIPVSSKKYDVYLVQPPSNSIVEVPSINNSTKQLIKNIPLALINTSIRPFPTDPGSVLKYLLIIENILFLLLAIYLLKNHDKSTNNEKKSWITFLILTGFFMLLLIGLTTPILGAIARYKTVSFLLFIISFSMLLPPLKFLKK